MKKVVFLIVLAIISFGYVVKAQTETLPTISVIGVDSITAVTAKFQGNLGAVGSWKKIKKVGFIIAPVNSLPGDTVNYSKSQSKVGSFSYHIATESKYLRPGTQYFVKAWVSKTGDTAYSQPYYFFTDAPICSEATTLEAENITLSSATVNGTVDAIGNAVNIPYCGFVCAPTPNPTASTPGAIIVPLSLEITNYPTIISGNFSGLVSDQTYYYRVWTANRYRDDYIDTCYADQKTFKTHHACGAIPTNLDTIFIGRTEAELKWQAAEGQTRFEVEYGIAGHELGTGDTVIVDTTYAKLTDLISNRSYVAYVRALCADRYSDWSDMRPFRTREAACERIMGLHVERANHLSVQIRWTPGTVSQTQWEVQCVKANRSYPISGFMVQGDPVYTPVGLEENEEYKMRVRGVCEFYHDTVIVDPTGTLPDETQTIHDSTVYGEWSDDLTFVPKDSEVGLNDMENEDIYAVSIYPNPSEGIVNFDRQDAEVKEIDIYSSLGTLVYTSKTLPNKIDLTKYGAGMYIILITTPQGVQSEKVIIK